MSQTTCPHSNGEKARGQLDELRVGENRCLIGEVSRQRSRRKGSTAVERGKQNGGVLKIALQADEQAESLIVGEAAGSLTGLPCFDHQRGVSL